MAECKACGYHNQPGSLFCADCGSMLVDSNQVEQSFIDVSALRALSGIGKAKTRERLTTVQDETDQLIFVILSSGRRVSFNLKGPIHVGRTDNTRKIKPDLDLTADQGLNHGVSREHAVVQVGNQGVSVVDLDSTNGTAINNRRLPPNEPYPLNDGDVIRFGRLVVQVFLREESFIRG